MGVLSSLLCLMLMFLCCGCINCCNIMCVYNMGCCLCDDECIDYCVYMMCCVLLVLLNVVVCVVVLWLFV